MFYKQMPNKMKIIVMLKDLSSHIGHDIKFK